MRRRMTYGKPLVEVVEALTTVGDGVWTVPDGCKEVEVFLVSGGGKAYNKGTEINQAGMGGGRVTLNLKVISGTKIKYTVGAGKSEVHRGSTSLFNSYSSRAGAHSEGGIAGASKAEDGAYPFDDNSLGYSKIGAGGGASLWNQNDVTAGGDYGGGGGGNSSRPNGENGSYYGAGGGQGFYSTLGLQGKDGYGYQGIIILRYKKYKK